MVSRPAPSARNLADAAGARGHREPPDWTSDRQAAQRTAGELAGIGHESGGGRGSAGYRPAGYKYQSSKPAANFRFPHVPRTECPSGAGADMSEHPQTGLHPDPDTLNAFIEGVLPEHERLACLTHFADCAACREVVYLAQEPEAPSPDP